jgi:hypothetical protein
MLGGAFGKPSCAAQTMLGVHASSKFHERQYFPSPARMRRVDRWTGWGLSQSAKFEMGLPEFILGGFSLSSDRASYFCFGASVFRPLVCPAVVKVDQQRFRVGVYPCVKAIAATRRDV